jgi:hypothetical protein
MPVLDFKIDSSGMVSGGKKVTDTLAGITKESDSAFGGIGKLGTGMSKVAVGAVAAFTAAILGAGVSLVAMGVESAVALEEIQNKFDVVFSGMTEEAEA